MVQRIDVIDHRPAQNNTAKDADDPLRYGTYRAAEPDQSARFPVRLLELRSANDATTSNEWKALGRPVSVGEHDVMEDPKPSRRVVSQRIRNRIIEYFDLVASYEAQVEYEQRVPFVNIPYEVINQWEDSVPPLPNAPVDHLDVFSAEELREIDLFRSVWDAAADAIGKDFPSLAFVQSLPEWNRLRERAMTAGSVFQKRGLLPEDREVPVNGAGVDEGIDSLVELVDRHRSSPFPSSIEKGTEYGEVEAVMIDADIFGWSIGIANGAPRDRSTREKLKRSRDQLEQSLLLMPTAAHDYFERLIRIADLALGDDNVANDDQRKAPGGS